MASNTYRLAGGGEPRAYRDPQWGGSMNFGWTKGDHNVKFGGEMKILHQNHYETQTPTFTFNGGRTALAPAGPNQFNAFADFLLGEVISRTSESMTPMIGDEPTVENIMDYRPATLRSNQYGVYIRDQFELNSKMTVSAGVRWEYYPLSQRADRGLEMFDFQREQLLICGVVRQSDETCGDHRRKESLHAAARLGLPPDRIDGHPRRIFAQPAERHVGPQPDAAVPGVPGHDHHHARQAREQRTRLSAA